jgi:hypothetical protein
MKTMNLRMILMHGHSGSSCKPNLGDIQQIANLESTVVWIFFQKIFFSSSTSRSTSRRRGGGEDDEQEEEVVPFLTDDEFLQKYRMNRGDCSFNELVGLMQYSSEAVEVRSKHHQSTNSWCS